MTEYWKNKYPVKFDIPSTNHIPEGTLFTVTGLRDNKFELTVVDESSGYEPVVIDLNTLLFGFSCSDKILYQSFVPNHSPLLDLIAGYVYKL